MIKPVILAAVILLSVRQMPEERPPINNIGDLMPYFESDAGVENPIKLAARYKKLIHDVAGIEVRKDAKIYLVEKGAVDSFYESVGAAHPVYSGYGGGFGQFEFFIKQLGLLEPGFRIGDFLTQYAKSNVAGAYNSGNKTLVIIKGAPWEKIESTLLHELFHAAQDNVVSLEALHESRKTTLDGHLALSSVIEGEAEFFGFLVFAKSEWDKNTSPGKIKIITDKYSKKISQRQNSGNFLSNLALFPYTRGFLMEAQRYLAARKFDVKKDFKNIPVSTTQVLHPDKANPGKVPAKASQARGVEMDVSCKQEYSTTAGEWFILSMFGQWFPSENTENEEAAAGWSGDKVAIYACENGMVYVWDTLWETGKDAEEFRARFQKRMTVTSKTKTGVKQFHPAIGVYGARVVIIDGAMPPSGPSAILSRIVAER